MTTQDVRAHIGYNHHILYKCYSNLANYSIAQAHEHEEGGVLASYNVATHGVWTVCVA